MLNHPVEIMRTEEIEGYLENPSKYNTIDRIQISMEAARSKRTADTTSKLAFAGAVLSLLGGGALSAYEWAQSSSMEGAFVWTTVALTLLSANLARQEVKQSRTRSLQMDLLARAR